MKISTGIIARCLPASYTEASMKKIRIDGRGFTVVEIFIVVIVIGLLGVVGYGVFMRGQDKDEQENTQTAEQPDPADSDVRWENTSERTWMAMGTPPACPDPFTLKSPTDLNKATSLLYPGQERKGEVFSGQGGNYKPHGGFRFDGLKNTEVSVNAPISGYVYRGSRYLIDGELQYTFDLVHPCGYMVRVGHLRALTPTFQKYADKFPAAAEMDSRTERVEGFPRVKAGDAIATAVGLPKNTNTFFDLGVFDLRKTNEASTSADYQVKHADSKEHTWYAVCWLDMLPQADASRIKALPAGDPLSGKNSDYCK